MPNASFLRRAILLAVAAAALVAAAPAAAYRELRPGDKGRDVRRFQEQLVALSYLPASAVTGEYDYRTEQADMAYEGWEGFIPDGIAGPRAQLRAFRTARRPRALVGEKGRRVEVRIAKQVLLLVDKHGRVRRAIHVSTGAGGLTPTGHFAVYSKSLYSWSRPFKVWMPYASYFSGGFALHQNPSVPGYPASHGCVRIPGDEAVVVYTFADVGTRVVIR